MTICLAALCRDGEEPHVVVAADRMVTLGSFIEFEHAQPKVATATAYALAMSAGDALTGSRLANDVRDGLSGTPPVLEAFRQARRTG